MTRQREIPSILYRQPNYINMTFPILPGVPKIRVSGAARLNDAYGNVAGVGGGGALTMFEVLSGATFASPSVRSKKVPFEDTNRGVTRMIFDPDDFATPAQPPGTSYLPTDDQTLFIRIEAWNPALNAWAAAGPITIIPPYDFFTTKEPVFTVTGIAPDMALGAWPAGLPDFMPPTVMNFMLPAYSQTISIVNLDAVGGNTLFVSFHPGMPPTVVKPDKDFGLTGSGVPEYFVGADNGNPWFTLRVAVVNSA